MKKKYSEEKWWRERVNKNLRLWIVSLEWEKKIKIKIKFFFRKLNKPKYKEKNREYIHKKDPIQKRKKEGETQKHKDITAERKRKGDMKKRKRKIQTKRNSHLKKTRRAKEKKRSPLNERRTTGWETKSFLCFLWIPNKRSVRNLHWWIWRQLMHPKLPGIWERLFTANAISRGL